MTTKNHGQDGEGAAIAGLYLCSFVLIILALIALFTK